MFAAQREVLTGTYHVFRAAFADGGHFAGNCAAFGEPPLAILFKLRSSLWDVLGAAQTSLQSDSQIVASRNDTTFARLLARLSRSRLIWSGSKTLGNQGAELRTGIGISGVASLFYYF